MSKRFYIPFALALVFTGSFLSPTAVFAESACTATSECSGDQACVAGKCTSPSADGGYLACTAATKETQCGATGACVNGYCRVACTEATAATACEGGQKCVEGGCVGTVTTGTGTSTPAAGQSGFVPLTSIQNLKFAGNAGQLPDFLNSIYMICIGLAAVIGVLQIMRAGVTWMTAAGSHEKIGEAKNLIRDTIVGIILVLAPTIVFSIINPDILQLKIGNLEKLKIEDSADSPESDESGKSAADILKGEGGAGACAVYVERKPVKIGTETKCADALKDEQWVNTSGSCCIGGTSPGWMCCGRTAQQTPKDPPAAGTFRFALAYEDKKLSGTFGEDGKQCVVRADETLSTKAACEAKLLGVITSIGNKTKFLIENCSGAKGDTTSGDWAKLQKLPQC